MLKKGTPCNGVAGWMQTTLNVPADFLFHELLDVQAYPQAVQAIVSMERYDPATVCYNKKKSKRPLSCFRASQRQQQHLATRQCINEEYVLAQPGHCYLQKRNFKGRPVFIKTQFTRFDEDYDDNNQRTFVTACSVFDCTITSTYVIEQFSSPPPPQEQIPSKKSMLSSSSSLTSTTTSSGGSNATDSSASKPETTGMSRGKPLLDIRSCRWTLSYAMLPDGWHGRLFFWRHGKQLKHDLHQHTLDEFEDLQRHVQARFYAINNDIPVSMTMSQALSVTPTA